MILYLFPRVHLTWVRRAVDLGLYKGKQLSISTLKQLHSDSNPTATPNRAPHNVHDKPSLWGLVSVVGRASNSEQIWLIVGTARGSKESRHDISIGTHTLPKYTKSWLCSEKWQLLDCYIYICTYLSWDGHRGGSLADDWCPWKHSHPAWGMPTGTWSQSTTIFFRLTLPAAGPSARMSYGETPSIPGQALRPNWMGGGTRSCPTGQERRRNPAPLRACQSNYLWLLLQT